MMPLNSILTPIVESGIAVFHIISGNLHNSVVFGFVSASPTMPIKVKSSENGKVMRKLSWSTPWYAGFYLSSSSSIPFVERTEDL